MPPTASAASAVRRCIESGDFTAFMVSAESLAICTGVMLAGASMPYHCVISKPGKPCSATVGTSGSCARRLAEPVAMQRTLPALMNGMIAAAPMAEASSRPESRSVTIGPVPR
ncbi:hypothetical protein D3C85_1217890 [compost metagenome]